MSGQSSVSERPPRIDWAFSVWIAVLAWLTISMLHLKPGFDPEVIPGEHRLVSRRAIPLLLLLMWLSLTRRSFLSYRDGRGAGDRLLPVVPFSLLPAAAITLVAKSVGWPSGWPAVTAITAGYFALTGLFAAWCGRILWKARSPVDRLLIFAVLLLGIAFAAHSLNRARLLRPAGTTATWKGTREGAELLAAFQLHGLKLEGKPLGWIRISDLPETGNKRRPVYRFEVPAPGLPAGMVLHVLDHSLLDARYQDDARGPRLCFWLGPTEQQYSKLKSGVPVESHLDAMMTLRLSTITQEQSNLSATWHYPGGHIEFHCSPGRSGEDGRVTVLTKRWSPPPLLFLPPPSVARFAFEIRDPRGETVLHSRYSSYWYAQASPIFWRGIYSEKLTRPLTSLPRELEFISRSGRGGPLPGDARAMTREWTDRCVVRLCEVTAEIRVPVSLDLVFLPGEVSNGTPP